MSGSRISRQNSHLTVQVEQCAHLYTELKLVFIRKVLEVLNIEGDEGSIWDSQMTIRTSSLPRISIVFNRESMLSHFRFCVSPG